MNKTIGSWLSRGTARRQEATEANGQGVEIASALQSLALSYTSALRFAEKRIEAAEQETAHYRQENACLRESLEARTTVPTGSSERFRYTTRCGNCAWEIGTQDPHEGMEAHQSHWKDLHEGFQVPRLPTQFLTANIPTNEETQPIGPADSMAVAGYTLAEALFWLFDSCDTGASSEAIFQQMVRGFSSTCDTPADSSDFGRCYRLLQEFPLWRHRLNEMSQYAGWTPLVEHWEELEAMYLLIETAIDPTEQNARHAILYRRIQHLNRSINAVSKGDA